MAKRTKENDPQAAYREQQEKVAGLMDTIRKKLDRHATGTVNWGHVGDLGHVEELLAEISTFLG
ncbi:MAG: hypothetical protein HZB23_00770 [Deltaproteobacteria bacterium]|nr:hypothetical protein [Deltaproteobacteria bacterium]